MNRGTLSGAPVISMNFTLSGSVTPSTGTARISAAHIGPVIAQISNPFGIPELQIVQWADDDSEISFPLVYVDAFERDEGIDGSIIYTVRFSDRRREWRNKRITGRYNILEDDGKTIAEGTAKTWQQLVQLCIAALDEEVSFSIQEFPNWSPSNLVWEMANAAEELQNLLTAAGLWLVMQPDGALEILQLGLGAIPSFSAQPYFVDDSWGTTRSLQPEQIIIKGRRKVLEERFSLVAVVERDDQTIVPLSAYGDVGASATLPEPFSDKSDADKNALKKCAYKWFQIQNIGVGESNYWKARRLLATRATSIAGTDGVERLAPPLVEALFFRRNQSGGGFTNDASRQVVSQGVTWDPKRAIVKLGAKAGTLEDTGTNKKLLEEHAIGSTDVVITVAYEVDTGAETDFYRYSYPAGSNAPTQKNCLIVERAEFVLYIDEDGTELNLTELNAQASELGKKLWSKFGGNETHDVTLAGARDVRLSGVVRTVAWDLSDSGLTTRVTINKEPLTVPAYEVQARQIGQNRAMRRQASGQARGSSSGASDSSPPPEEPEVTRMMGASHTGLFPVRSDPEGVPSSHRDEEMWCRIIGWAPTTGRHSYDQLGRPAYQETGNGKSVSGASGRMDEDTDGTVRFLRSAISWNSDLREYEWTSRLFALGRALEWEVGATEDDPEILSHVLKGVIKGTDGIGSPRIGIRWNPAYTLTGHHYDDRPVTFDPWIEFENGELGHSDPITSQGIESGVAVGIDGKGHVTTQATLEDPWLELTDLDVLKHGALPGVAAIDADVLASGANCIMGIQITTDQYGHVISAGATVGRCMCGAP